MTDQLQNSKKEALEHSDSSGGDTARYGPPQWAIELVNQLERWKTSSGIMADLRRGRGKKPIDCVSMHRWVSRFVSDEQVGSGKEWAVYTVASQFALHPNLKSCNSSLGISLNQLVRGGSFSEQQIESRLIRLTQSRTSAELCRRIPGVLALIASGGASLSWSWLAWNINGWDFRSSLVARQWLRDFYWQRQDIFKMEVPHARGGVS